MKNMKKYIFMVAALALTTMVSCNKEEINNSPEEAAKPSYYVEFTAEAANEDVEPQSKTKYDEQNKKTLWESDDAISVNGKKFTLEALIDGGLKAKFVNEGDLGGDFTMPYVAVTPYQEGVVVNGSTVTGIKLPSTQTATAASFQSDVVVAMAYNETNNELSFKNACSIVKFKVGTSNVKKVTIQSNNGENLAGTISLRYNNGQPEVTSVESGSSVITLSGEFNTTDTYYVAVLASGLENGITICLDGTIAKTVANELAFKRNVVMNAGTLNVSSTENTSWTIVGGHNSWDTTTGTKMYEERGLLVAKGVSITAAGFKIIKDASWDGAVGAGSGALNKWISAGGNNIEPGEGTYDIYMPNDGVAYYIAKAGSPAPSAWSVVGIPNFETDIIMYPMGEYLVAKSVNVTEEAEYKFRTYGRWNTSLSGSNKDFVQKEVYATESSNDNIKITAGTYDIYLTGNAAYFFVVPAGHSLNDNDIIVKNKSIIGKVNGSSWDQDLEMYICGDYFGRKDVLCNGAFKFRQNSSWSNADVWGKGSDNGVLAQPGSDIPAQGTYDILVDHNYKNYYLK